MGKANLERIERPADDGLAEMGQTCCHRMQIGDVADKPCRAHILFNCASHGNISFDIVYDEGGGDKTYSELKEEITEMLVLYDRNAFRVGGCPEVPLDKRS